MNQIIITMQNAIYQYLYERVYRMYFNNKLNYDKIDKTEIQSHIFRCYSYHSLIHSFFARLNGKFTEKD